MPFGVLLVLVGNVQQATFFEIIANDLQADRPAINEAGRYRHAGQPGTIDRYGLDIGQVHRNRIFGFLTQPECGTR